MAWLPPVRDAPMRFGQGVSIGIFVCALPSLGQRRPASLRMDVTMMAVPEELFVASVPSWLGLAQAI